MPSRKEKKEARKAAYSALIEDISGDAAALELLARSSNPYPRLQLTDLLHLRLASLGIPSPAGDLFAGFLGWCAHTRARQLPDQLEKALVLRMQNTQVREEMCRELAARLRLRRLDEAGKAAWLDKNTTEVFVDPLTKPYPDYHWWVAESPETAEQWRPRIEEGKQADRRHTRHPIAVEDPSKLAHIVHEEESVVFRDRKTGKVVMIIIRDFCKDKKVLAYANGETEQSADMRRSVRLEDPGKLVLLGYTAGSRSHPLYDWARNLRSSKHTAEFIREHDFRVSSVFALFWNLIQSHLPEEVLAPFELYLSENSMGRMDANSKSRESKGIYMVECGDEYVEFNDAELAPPAGVAGCNYARAIHREKQPQKWAFSWTTSRRKGMTGGSFYEAVYGIKVCQAPNTMIAWMPEHDHGTSLLDYSSDRKEDVPPFAQAGIAFVTSTRLASTWQKYVEGEDFATAEKEWVESMEDDVESSCGDELCTLCLDDGYNCSVNPCPICI
ncbi:uncharacterized protein B0H18DRAFT_1040298 [Fomitopsis serialis]|uniref:uncharacterized protein n=1 Tax=Fomitopsis serialis TaxID=139415 RepID=UPI002008B179|nr:uncharacterized protein B0H18DRAFT_1040298 [Neoantrodia serialis]KAH9915751.1 hypothetical protein B0H18DRAFT_1040298 [Neoantrodia serialis]